MDDAFGIVANVLSDRVLRTGAKVWIRFCNGDASCPLVMGVNKSGRFVRKYTHYKRLTNFRSVWIPEHLRAEIIWKWESKNEAAEFASLLGEQWKGIRYYSRDGKTLMKDGQPEREAFRRALTKISTTAAP